MHFFNGIFALHGKASTLGDAIKPENGSWGVRPLRALLDTAPETVLWGTRDSQYLQLFDASDVFREGAENCARGGRAPHFNSGFRV